MLAKCGFLEALYIACKEFVDFMLDKVYLKNSEIPFDLTADYCRANYRVGMHADFFTLHVNQYSESMRQLMEARDVVGAAIITAYNPFSQLQKTPVNLAAHAMLLETLKDNSEFCIEGINIDPSGTWPEEKSVCVLGIDLAAARSLGQRFQQNAVVWIGNNAIPRLVLLR